MKSKTRPAAMPEPSSAPEAEVPKWQSANLCDVSVSLSKLWADVHLRHVRGDHDYRDLVLSLDWRAAAALLDFADRKLDSADALLWFSGARSSEAVEWSLPSPEYVGQTFSMEPRFVWLDVEGGQFILDLVDPWQPEHRVCLFLSGVSLRAIVTELRAGLAVRRQARRF